MFSSACNAAFLTLTFSSPARLRSKLITPSTITQSYSMRRLVSWVQMRTGKLQVRFSVRNYYVNANIVSLNVNYFSLKKIVLHNIAHNLHETVAPQLILTDLISWRQLYADKWAFHWRRIVSSFLAFYPGITGCWYHSRAVSILCGRFVTHFCVIFLWIFFCSFLNASFFVIIFWLLVCLLVFISYKLKFKNNFFSRLYNVGILTMYAKKLFGTSVYLPMFGNNFFYWNVFCFEISNNMICLRHRKTSTLKIFYKWWPCAGMTDFVLCASGVGTTRDRGGLFAARGVTICRIVSLINGSLEAEHCANPWIALVLTLEEYRQKLKERMEWNQYIKGSARIFRFIYIQRKRMQIDLVSR